ncbi:MAG: alpha/beta hydrolase, partial [Intrasporangiaceae bacterium]|nr:alpha/beta hydrolase [Intrasporangiaceae bacterium]
PAVVDRGQDGDLAPLANIVALLDQQLEGAVTAGMQWSMLCTGEAALADPDQALAEVDDELITGRWYPHTMLGEPVGELCERWDVEQRYDPAEIILDTEVPTLIVTGGLDHVTPPELGEQVHDALPASHLIEVDDAVHAPLEALSLPGPCGQNLVTDFLDDPDSTPDAECAADFEMQLGTPLPPGLG